MIATKDGTQIFYKDWGPRDAQPIVFHHGWPLSSDDWDGQMLFFLANGSRYGIEMIAPHRGVCVTHRPKTAVLFVATADVGVWNDFSLGSIIFVGS
jgi:pimeloyl-ACP methyl ester carboxylesterase